MNDKNNISFLGEFTDLQSVWKQYPSGGCNGDYITISGKDVYWNEHYDIWGDPEDMGCDSIYNSKAGSLIVKGNFCLTAVPPERTEVTSLSGIIIPAFNSESRKWIFVDSSMLGPNPIPSDTVTILGNVNPTSMSHGYIKCGDKRSDPATGEIKVTVAKGSTVKMEFVAEKNFQVSRVNIDKVSQGIITSYTFENVITDHTMYVWYDEMASSNSTTIYKRNDIENEYQSIYLAVKSLMLDYPNGLTQNVTIVCTKDGVDYRKNEADQRLMGEDLYTLFIKDWNEDSSYILTLDGDNKATIDGNGFGGFYIKDSSNIVVKNFIFQNIYTLEGMHSPEESACIFAVRVAQDVTCRNLYIDNIKIIGQSTISPDSTFRIRYGITIKGFDNVTITNCNIKGVSLTCIRIEDAEVADVSNNKISGNMQLGIIGHPCLISVLGRQTVFLEDNDIDASTFSEPAVRLNGFNKAHIRRNKIYNSGGPVIQCIREESDMEEIDISYNLMYGNMKRPLYSWECSHFMIGNADKLKFNNNTIHTTSTYYQEFIFRNECNIKTFINVNNIIIRKSNINFGVFLFQNDSTIDNIIANNNIYQIGSGTIYKTNTISSSDGASLSKLQAMGIDVNSSYMDVALNILLKETGGSRYCLTTQYANIHKSLPEYVEEFDVRYMKNDPTTAVIGCDNYFSTAFNEADDASTGYIGINLGNSDRFSNSLLYESPALDGLMLQHNTKIRGKFILFIVTKDGDSTFKHVATGKRTLLELLPIVDENGEYVNNQLYNITVSYGII